ncbi:VapE domain-containing protein [Nannocystis pusilla]|uniref:VapE domain-containing protein n=1 Tax=Nannocystis pusilla TaxID=889268 RepID=UPI003DA6560C
MTPKIWDVPSKEDAKRGGIGLQELQGSRLFVARRYAAEHKLEITGADLLTCDGGDPRPKLYGMRATLGDCLCIPKRDREGKIRTWVGRRVHTAPVDQVAGDYEHGEALPPGHQQNPKYVYLPKVRRDSAAGESSVKEEKFYPLLLSPNFLDSKAPIWICEGVIDAVLADQAGAAAIGMDGAYAYIEKVEELFRVLSGPAKQHREIYLCFDLDPARTDTGKELQLGPGQRGACLLLADILKRSHLLFRKIKVVSLPRREDGGKVDLGDVLAAASAGVPWPGDDADLGGRLAYDRAVAERQRQRLQELQLEAVDPWVHMLAQLPAEVAVRDRSSALEEVGLLSVAAHDPDLWAEIEEEAASKLAIPKKELAAWKKLVRSLVTKIKAEKKAEGPEDDADLSRHTRKDGSIVPCYEAIYLLVERLHGQAIWWDEMAMVPMLGGEEMSPVRLGQLRLRLAREFKCDIRHSSDLREVIDNIAGQNRRHPVREYLRNLPTWDGIDRIPQLMSGVLHLSPETEDQRILWTAFLRRWMIGGVARAHATAKKPEKMDTVLVLAGDQGSMKSTFFEYLSPDPSWFGSPDISDFSDGAAIKLAGLWIVEMAESNGSSYWKDLERQKAFLSKKTDRIIRKYVAYSESIPRTCILGATVNEQQFLADSTGFRRQWCVYIKEKVDLALLTELRDLLWAQALASFKSGEQWYLTPEEVAIHQREGQAFMAADLERDKIAAWLAQQPSKRVTGLSIADGIGITRPSSNDGRRIARHMKALGWGHQHTREGTAYLAPEGWAPSGGLEVLEGGAGGQLFLSSDFLD